MASGVPEEFLKKGLNNAADHEFLEESMRKVEEQFWGVDVEDKE